MANTEYPWAVRGAGMNTLVSEQNAYSAAIRALMLVHCQRRTIPETVRVYGLGEKRGEAHAFSVQVQVEISRIDMGSHEARLSEAAYPYVE